VTADRIARLEWVKQARKLASEKAKTGKTKKVALANRQHYENFTVEVLIGASKEIRRVRVVHVQSGDIDTWAGWEAQRLIDFLARHIGEPIRAAGSDRLPLVKPITDSTAAIATPQSLGVATKAISTPHNNPVHAHSERSTSELAVLASPTLANLPSEPNHHQIVAPSATAKLGDEIRLLGWKTLLNNTEQSSHSLPQNHPFDVLLNVDLNHSSIPTTSQLNFNVMLYARKLGTGTRQLIGITHKIQIFNSIVTLTVSHITLLQGVYRLEALVTLKLGEPEQRHAAERMAVLETSPLLIY
jgi:hypothetical protein